MGQRLYLIRKDKYRLNVDAFDNKEIQDIKHGDSQFNLRFSFKEKLSEPAVESVEADVVDGNLGFKMYTSLPFGSYLYVIEKIDMAKEVKDELAYGFIDVMPDV